jgi:HK97 gp10 family phage protein
MADQVITAKLVGRDDVVAAFKELQEDLPKSWLRNSMRAGVQLIYSAILRYVPYRTGKLARNISVRTQQSGDWLRARVTVNTFGKASDPANAFYWRFLEKGWHDRGGAAHREEFAQPAIQAHQQEAAQLVIDSVGAALAKAEARAARSGA